MIDGQLVNSFFLFIFQVAKNNCRLCRWTSFLFFLFLLGNVWHHIWVVCAYHFKKVEKCQNQMFHSHEMHERKFTTHTSEPMVKWVGVVVFYLSLQDGRLWEFEYVNIKTNRKKLLTQTVDSLTKIVFEAIKWAHLATQDIELVDNLSLTHIIMSAVSQTTHGKMILRRRLIRTVGEQS